jgi:ribosomal protein S18 acetylase RimI-like enzyme
LIQFSEMIESDEADVVALWHECKLTRAWNDPAQDMAFALGCASSTILVGKLENKIVASAMVGHDGHRGALYYVAVHPRQQKKKIGSHLIEAAEEWLKRQGIWKINIMIREDNLGAIGFYKALGFEKNAVVSMGKKIS